MTQSKLPRPQLNALNAFTRHEYLVSAQSGDLDAGICAWSTLNQLRDKGLVEIHYTDAGERAGWITDEGREARERANGPTRPWPRPLTDTQAEVLAALKEHGPWGGDDPGLAHRNRSTTRTHLDALVIKGWVHRSEDGIYTLANIEEG